MISCERDDDGAPASSLYYRVGDTIRSVALRAASCRNRRATIMRADHAWTGSAAGTFVRNGAIRPAGT